MPRLIIAVEGPCCAGKTTLIRRLRHELADLPVAHVACYADHVGGGRHLPSAVPRSLGEDAAGLAELIRIERERTRTALETAGNVVIADRGLHTLLAHRYAIAQVTGLACFQPAQQLLAVSHLPTWPDLVLYLDVPQDVVYHRNHGKFPADSIFIDPAYNAAFRSYFSELATHPSPQTAWLDATTSPDELAATVQTTIRQLLCPPAAAARDHTRC